MYDFRLDFAGDLVVFNENASRLVARVDSMVCLSNDR